jgi:hypothetical protein
MRLSSQFAITLLDLTLHVCLQVGISAEFPSGLHSDVNFDHKSFFDFLLAGEEASERIPEDRFNIDGCVI